MRLLRVDTAVQAAVTILGKECVDGFYSGLKTEKTRCVAVATTLLMSKKKKILKGVLRKVLPLK